MFKHSNPKTNVNALMQLPAESGSDADVRRVIVVDAASFVPEHTT